MAKDTVKIPVPVVSSIETLDELQDWLTAQNPPVVAELREARRQDLAGEFEAWEPTDLVPECDEPLLVNRDKIAANRELD
jgi:hypothetical protein